MQELKIILFRDGRPGHEKQSKGIIKALQKYVRLDISEREVSKKPSVKYWFDFLLSRQHSNNTQRADEQVDLVIGTGSSTHLPMLATKKLNNCRAVVCMRPSFLVRSRFDLCFVPLHDRPVKNDNIIETVGPPNMSEISDHLDPQKTLILIGGENRMTKPWDSEKILSDIQTVIHRSNIQNLTISTSPRTPVAIEKKLAIMARGYENTSYFSYRDTPPGWVEKQYSVNKVVWVTADSMSMVYEAMSAGCHVGIIPVKWKKKDNKYNYSLTYLQAKKRIITLNQLKDGNTTWGEIAPLAEAEKCAKEILKRWWPKTLQ